jgi:hypothetical protein
MTYETPSIYTSTCLKYLWFIKIDVIANNTFFYKTYYIKFLLKKGWISSFDIIKINLSSKMRFSNIIQAFSVKACRIIE